MTVPVGRAMLASQLASSNNTKIDQFPANIGAHGMLMIFNGYRFERPTTRTLLRLPTNTGAVIRESNGAVLLPIPNALIDSNNLRISREDMINVLGAETAAASAAMVRNAGFEAASMAAINAVSNLNTPNSSDALFIAKRLFGDNFLLGPISQGLGMTLNPKASLLFQGVELREFEFNWTLAPTEQKESDILRNITNRIKSNALPWYNSESLFTTSMLRYPSTVDIYLLGVDPGYFMFFKTAMISDFSTNFTPNGLSILRGGKPSAINLNIRLKEMDIHTANDYGLTDSAMSIMEEENITNTTRQTEESQVDFSNAFTGINTPF